MVKIYQENRKRAEEGAGEQSEERERRCCSVPVPHCWLPVVSMGTRPSGKGGKPRVVRLRCNGDGVSSGPGAAGPVPFAVPPPRSAFLSHSSGGAEVPGVAPRELLLRGLLHERPWGRGGK